MLSAFRKTKKVEKILTLFEAIELSEDKFFSSFIETTDAPKLVKPGPGATNIIPVNARKQRTYFKYSKYYDNLPHTVPRQFGVTDIEAEDVS